MVKMSRRMPPDAGRRTLVGLDRGGMVVALDAHGHRDAVAGVDHPGVLARADEHAGALGGQAAQVQPGRLVRAVLAPHHRVERELEVVGGPAEDLADGLELVVGQAERPVQRLLRRWLVGRQRLGRRSHGDLHDRGRAATTGGGRAAGFLNRDGRLAAPRGRCRTTPRPRRSRRRPASAAGRPPSRGGRGPRVPGVTASAGSTGMTTSPRTKRPPGRSTPAIAGEERRLVRAFEVVDGQSRDHQVEGAGAAAGRPGSPPRARPARPARRVRAASSMRSFLSTPTAVAPG